MDRRHLRYWQSASACRQVQQPPDTARLPGRPGADLHRGMRRQHLLRAPGPDPREGDRAAVQRDLAEPIFRFEPTLRRGAEHTGDHPNREGGPRCSKCPNQQDARFKRQAGHSSPLEGIKKSSKGNVFLLEDAVKEFGADTVRMFLMGSAEPWQDFDWRNELVLSTRKQIERFYNTVTETKDASGEPHDIDRWLASRLQSHIARTTEALDNFQTRQALQEAYFGIESDLKWYRRRLPKDCDGSRELHTLCSVWTRLLAPFIPFTAEHLWKELAGEGLISFAPWPVALYGLVMLCTAIAYFILVHALLALHGKDSPLATAVGPDLKGKVSLVFYAIAIPLAFVNSWLASGLYVVVALIWFIPDRRIERALAERGQERI